MGKKKKISKKDKVIPETKPALNPENISTPPKEEIQVPAHKEELGHIVPVKGLFENWFLDYASYVILERAVPYVEDGLKPVHRRILHSLKELDDGRFNKVANIIGNTMKYHPHGDASIGDALVQLGQKDLLIETQGNWGNLYTGDNAAAPRYIEARLSKFALEVVFHERTTVWQSSYDGRNKEPVKLPIKFPLLLAQGVEGIAVGLACKILPHNFNELLQASIDVLRKKKINILPDFFTGGIADFSQYNEGLRGGKIRIRAKIEKKDRKTLIITQLPFGTTTTSLIESVLSANDKGKIKIKRIEDNTSDKVEILVHLHSDSYEDLDKSISALYAFTDCEVSISPNACIIRNDKPEFISVNEILKISAFHSVELLKRELLLKLSDLQEDWHFSSLEKIFIEKRIYRDIEECETWEAVIEAIFKGLKPFAKKFRREITRDDIVKLTEIKIKRISKFDAKKADEHIKGLNEQMGEVQKNLDNLIGYTIDYFKSLLKKYGKGRERKTEIASFGNIVAKDVAVANTKLFVNRDEGFAGWGLKKDELVCECSDMDDIIAFTGDGKFMVSKISEKKYFGKDIVHIAVFNKNNEDLVYHMIYRDGLKGNVLAKRFNIGGVTRDKEYELTRGTNGSKVLYFHLLQNLPETVTIHLKPKPKLRILSFDFNFADMAVKGRSSMGNIVSRNSVHRIVRSRITSPPVNAPKLIDPPVPALPQPVQEKPKLVEKISKPNFPQKPESKPKQLKDQANSSKPVPAIKKEAGKKGPKKPPGAQMKLFGD